MRNFRLPRKAPILTLAGVAVLASALMVVSVAKSGGCHIQCDPSTDDRCLVPAGLFWRHTQL